MRKVANRQTDIQTTNKHRQRWPISASFLPPVFPVSRVQHISDLHSKFALRPHHVSKYGRHPICDRRD